MLSKNKIKFIRSLAYKKFRDENHCFLAEGPKVVGDLMGHFPCHLLAATSPYLQSHREYTADEVTEATMQQLEQASLLKSPREVIAVFSMDRLYPSSQKAENHLQELSIALDGIQDPGNLGTIIRIGDWFGIHNIYCSEDCVDAFSPKVVQATMGALARVCVHYTHLPDFIRRLRPDTAVYGTFLDGEDIYASHLSQGGIVVMGNEGKGISPEVEKLISKRLFIPNYPEGTPTSESLNVAVATAITCAEFRRQSK